MGAVVKDPRPDRKSSSHSRRRSLRAIYLASIGLVPAALVVVTFIELTAQQRAFESDLIETNDALAQHSAEVVADFVEHIEIVIRASAQGAVAGERGLPNVGQLQLLNLLKVAPPVMAASVIDTEGQEVARVARYNSVAVADFRDLSGIVAFQRALVGQSYRSEPYFVRDSEPHMTISVPILRLQNEFEGALAAEVSLLGLAAVLAGLAIGQDANAYVVSSAGDLIGHADLSLVLQRQNLSELDQVGRALGGLASQVNVVSGFGDTPVIAAHASIPELDWLVVVERDAAQTTAPLGAASSRVLVQLAIVLAVAAVAAFWIYRRFLRPALALSQAATRMHAGNYAQRVEPGANDELAVVAGALNHMSGRLGDLHTLLTEQVRRRTLEITAALQASVIYSKATAKGQGAADGEQDPISASEAVLMLQRAIAEGPVSDPALAASLRTALCQALVQADRPEEAREAFDRAIIEAGPLGAFAEFPAVHAILSARGHPELLEVRLKAGQRALGLVREVSFDDAVINAVSWHFTDLLAAGDFESARRVVERFSATTDGKLGGSSVRTAEMRIVLAMLAGIGEEVEELIDASYAEGIRRGHADPLKAYCLRIVTLRRERGRSEEARPAVDDLREGHADIRMWGPLSALIDLDSNDPAQARETFEQVASAGFDTIPRDERRPITLALLAEVCAGLRDSSRAKALYEVLQPHEGQNIAATAVCLGAADRYLGMLSAVREEWSTAEHHFESAIELSESQPLWRARAKFDLSSVLVRQHQNERAAAFMDEAMAAAIALGMVRLRENCLFLLAKEPHEGPKADGLTSAELRVLRLLSLGATNRGIGEQLHVSPSTVANHVRNILAKTGSSNRTEAANYARQNSLIPRDESTPTRPS